MSQDDLQLLMRFPELQVLDLGFMNIDDQHLTALTQLPELRRLTVMSPLLTANSAVTLEHIPRLAIWFGAGPLDCADIAITRFSCKGVYGR